MTEALEILTKAYTDADSTEARIKLSHAIKWLKGMFYRPSTGEIQSNE